MKKLNIPLIVGLIIILGILFLIFFGEYYAPHDANGGVQEYWGENEAGERILIKAPFPPDENYIFGTDNGGRDVLSLIMAGARNTFIIVLLATLCRFLVAIPIAFLSAFGERISKSLITIFSATFSAVPSLLICIMILKVSVISELPLRQSILVFVVVFTLVGWGRLASIIEGKIKDILKQDFIQGEVAIGKSKFAIATKNVTAHAIPSIIILLFLEISMVLLLLAQLGVFEVFVGNKEVFVIKYTTRQNFNFFPEWGAMLAATKQSITNNRFWLSLYPLSAFSVSIIGFNLLGEGLNYELNKRNSRFISKVNKLWFHLSPITFIGELINFKKKKRNVIIKVCTMAVVLLLIIIPILNAIIIVDEGVMAHVYQLSKVEYEGRLIGTEGHRRVAEYIASRLEEYKIQPLFNGEYYSEFSIPTYNIIGDSEFTVSNSFGEITKELKYKVDYYFEGWPSDISEIEAELLTMEDYMINDFDDTKDYFLVLGYLTDQSSTYDKLVAEGEAIKNIKGIIIPNPKVSSFFSSKSELDKRGLTKIFNSLEGFGSEIQPAKIIIGSTAARGLWSLAGNTITIRAEITHPNSLMGRNIGGIIEGRNPQNPIVIATSYDYLGEHDLGVTTNIQNVVSYPGLYENGTSIAGSLELAKNLGDINKKPERSIIFLFIDGTKVNATGVEAIKTYDFINHQPLIIYLNYMGITKWQREEDSLYNNTIIKGSDTAAERDFYKWLRRNSSSRDYYIIEDREIIVDILQPLKDEDMNVIVLQGLKVDQISWHTGMAQSNLDEIDVERLTVHIQYLLDSIKDMVYGKGWY